MWHHLWDEADLPAVEGEGEGLPLNLHGGLRDGLELQASRRREIWNTAEVGDRIMAVLVRDRQHHPLGCWLGALPPCRGCAGRVPGTGSAPLSVTQTQNVGGTHA